MRCWNHWYGRRTILAGRENAGNPLKTIIFKITCMITIETLSARLSEFPATYRHGIIRRAIRSVEVWGRRTGRQVWPERKGMAVIGVDGTPESVMDVRFSHVGVARFRQALRFQIKQVRAIQ